VSYAEHGHTFSLEASERTSEWWQVVETEHAEVCAQLNHMINIVREHRAHDECPIYCWGDHFSDDVQAIVNDGRNDIIVHMLYLACARLTGTDTR
jgi:hypothetical protein